MTATLRIHYRYTINLKVVLRNEPVRSFVPLSKSRGANFVKIDLTTDQKVHAPPYSN